MCLKNINLAITLASYLFWLQTCKIIKLQPIKLQFSPSTNSGWNMSYLTSKTASGYHLKVVKLS